jgi:IS30 family transposase
MSRELDLYNSGLSIRAIAKSLNTSPSKVARKLRSDPDYVPRAIGSSSASGEPMKRISFHLEETLIQKLGSYPNKADFLRSAVKEKLDRSKGDS